jgi:ATP-dependent Clp protease ATP-binding subunit ClpC
MDFIVWHYSKGLEYYLQSWLSYFGWIGHYFSLPLLLKTLFSPWKRLVEEDRSPGFDLPKYIRSLTFNLISRGIGAVARFFLFWVGVVVLLFVFLGGFMGLFFWIIFPFFGIPLYRKSNRQPKHFIKDLLIKLKKSKSPIKIIFESDAGKFVLDRTGLAKSELVTEARLEKVNFTTLKPSSFEKLVGHLIKSGVWSKDFLLKKGLVSKDLILAASWWESQRDKETRLNEVDMGKPGIGLELIFGYTPNLNRYSVDLAAPQPFSHRLIGREGVVNRMERVLTAGSNVMLTGQPGVGKRTVVLEFAYRASHGLLKPAMAYRRVLEFDYNFILSKTIDLNRKKTKLSLILEEAALAGNVIIVVRDIQRLTHPEVEKLDFTDIFENFLAKRDLKIIAIATPTEYERFIAPNMRLRKYFETVEVAPPSKEEALEILVESAQKEESLREVTIRVDALRKILDESDRYITETPFPEKALELLESVITFLQQRGENVVTVAAVNSVLAEKTGISFARLTKKEKERLSNLEEIIHERLINQEAAVDLIAKSLRARTVGASESKRPLGSFLFMGPTGVGKTETAKVLAKQYYGSEENIIRFDMAEYAGKEGLERLIGSVEKNLPGTLSTAIKKRPASLLLLDEIEKATPEISNLFLALLDEGAITDAFGKKISARNLFVIGTSNAAAEHVRKLVSSGLKGEVLQKEVVEYVLQQQIFSPELLNRFDGVVVYEPLEKNHLVKIAHLMLGDLANNLKKKGVNLRTTPETAEKLAEDGYNPAFGARPMRRIVDLVIGDLIGKAILSGEIKEGDRIEILASEGKEEFNWQKISPKLKD